MADYAFATVGKKFWDEDVAPHTILDTLWKQVRADNEERIQAYKEYARMYGADMSTLYGGGFASPLWTEDLTINELANTIESLHGTVFGNEIIPACCTVEGDWDQQERAKGTSRWIEGVFDDCRIHQEVVPVAGLDSIVFGTGAAFVYSEKTYREGKDGEMVPRRAKIRVERVNPLLLYVDKAEAKHGKPRTLFRKDHIDRYKLLEDYGSEAEHLFGAQEDRKKAILGAPGNDDEDFEVSEGTRGDSVTVMQAWHLPSGPDADDGCHVVWIEGCTLQRSEYKHDTFPFVMFNSSIKLSGFWGDSLIKRLGPIQRAYDKLTKRIDVCHDLLGVPKLLIPTGGASGSGVKKAHIDDVEGSFIEYNPGQKPEEWNPVPITPSAYSERDSLPGKMKANVGVSSFEASQQLPPQLREASGESIDRMVESASKRQEMFHRSYQTAMVDLAMLMIREARECVDEGFKVVVQAKGGISGSVELLDFAKVEMDRDLLKLRILPISNLPKTFAGRVKELGELRDRNSITEQTFRRLLQVPDIEAENDLDISDDDIIRKNLTWMVNHGEKLEVLPWDNLDLIVKLGTKFINLYRIREDADDEMVGIIGEYINDAVRLKSGLPGPSPQGPAPGAPPPPMAPGMPVGPGMAPPMPGGPGAVPGPGPVPMGPQVPPGMPGVPGGPLPPM